MAGAGRKVITEKEMDYVKQQINHILQPQFKKHRIEYSIEVYCNFITIRCENGAEFEIEVTKDDYNFLINDFEFTPANLFVILFFELC